MALDSSKVYNSPVLDLQELIHTPEGKIKAEISLDLSDLDFFGKQPIQNPVSVVATITNHAGALLLEGTISSLLMQHCDRCNAAVSVEKVTNLSTLLAAELEDEEHDEIILLEGTLLNLEEVATTAYILEMDTKTLCSEDCAGLCATCGANLNENPCQCKKTNDSPFAALASLLDD